MKINKQQLQRIIKEEVRRAKRRLAEGHGGMGGYGGRDEENHGKRDGMAYGGRDEEDLSKYSLADLAEELAKRLAAGDFEGHDAVAQAMVDRDPDQFTMDDD